MRVLLKMLGLKITNFVTTFAAIRHYFLCILKKIELVLVLFYLRYVTAIIDVTIEIDFS